MATILASWSWAWGFECRDRKWYAYNHVGRPKLPITGNLLAPTNATHWGQAMRTVAEAGIPDYWVVNLVDKQIEVYRDPSGKNYQQHLTYQGDEATHPLALPQAKLTPSQLFRN